MQNLDEALAFSSYQATLSRQKTIIRQTFQDQCLLGYNGGLFFITPEFISGLDALGHTARYVVDHNQNPIWIEELSNFKTKALECYTAAVQAYGDQYSKLKIHRSVKALVGL
jgi:hypothetical protein